MSEFVVEEIYMSNSQNGTTKPNTFMKNASFLMVATLISRVIGLLYRSPLRRAVGETGMGYYGLAYTMYAILLLISAYSIPMAVAKVISERLAVKEYRNAHTVFKAALLYATIVGGAAALFAFFFGNVLIPPKQQEAFLALQVLAPTIFLSAILGVLRGYFQAHNNMMPTAISQIVEQIVNAVVSVVAAILFAKTFASDETGKAVFGAAGGAFGTGVGVFVGLAFMFFVYMVNKKTINRRIANDNTKNHETLKAAMKIIVLMVTPIVFSTFIYSANDSINSYLFPFLMGRKGADSKWIIGLFGEYSQCFLPLINIPLALSSATSSAALPEIAAMYKNSNIDAINHKIRTAIRLTMFICIPAAMGLTVLAFPIMVVLFPNITEVSGNLLMFGAFSVIFMALSTIMNGALQAIGKPQIPLRNAAISLGIDVVALVGLLWFTESLNIYAILIAMILFAVSMCVLNYIALSKYLGYKNEYRDTYIRPFLASVGMGIVAWLSYYSLHIVVPARIVCLGVAVVLGIIVYILIFVIISKTTEEELRRFPFGNFAVKFMRLIKVYK